MSRIYLSDSTSYLGKILAETFRRNEQNELFQKDEKTAWDDVDPDNLPNVYVLNLTANQDKLHEVRLFLSKTEFVESTIVIGISTVMTWGKTNKNPAKGLKETKYTTRKSSPKFKATRESESLILRLRKENLQSFVVAPGILYGNGENAFHLYFKDAWRCEKPALNVIGDGKNKIPTIHVQDLCNFVNVCIQNPGPVAERGYVVAVDNSKSSQLEIVKRISEVVGNGEVVRVPANDESVLLGEFAPTEIVTTDMHFKEDDLFINTTEFQWIAQNGLVEYMPTLREEFVAARKLTPLRVMLHGPPGSGKSLYGKLLAKEYYIPHVTVGGTIEEVKEQKGPLRDRVLKTLADLTAALKDRKKNKNKNKKRKGKRKEEEERPRLPVELVTEIMRKKLLSPPCRNKGYILDGYPRTLEEAKLLFEKRADEEDDEESKEEQDESTAQDGENKTNFDPLTTPNHIIALEVAEDTASKRFKSHGSVIEGHNDEDGFRRRWAKFHHINESETAQDQAGSPLTLVSHVEVLMMPEEDVADVKKGLANMKIYLETGGKPFNYHPTPEETAALQKIQAEKEALEKAQKSKEQEQKSRAEAVERKERELANRLRRELVLGEDQKLVEASSLPLRKYLMKSVVPALVDGLLDVCKVQPDDPVDYLAEYLFNHATSQN